MSERINTILFDLDGTLLYTIGDLTTAINRTMKQFGYPLHTEGAVLSFVNNGALALVKKALPESERSEENVRKVHDIYLEHYTDCIFEKTYPYDGIEALLSNLKKAGLKLGIVTNKPDIHAKMLASHFFGDTFGYVCGSGQDLPKKPDPACVDNALAALGGKKETTLFVGDSQVDAHTGANSGVLCAGVLWGFMGKESFPEKAPDLLISNPSEIEKLVLG